MKRILLVLFAPLALASSGCFGHYVDCDGDECEYVEAPAPQHYQVQPYYDYHGTYVYEYNGRYYRQYGKDRRWVAYRNRPRGLRHDVRPHRHDHGRPGGERRDGPR